MDQGEQLKKRLEDIAAGKPVPPSPMKVPKVNQEVAFQSPPKPVHQSAVTVTDVRLTGNAQVEVTNINISFWRMVMLMVKVAFASIPAAILVGLITYAAWSVIFAMVLKRTV